MDMKKVIYSFAAIMICFTISSCQKPSQENSQKSNMSDKVSYDFYSFLQSPEATEKQDVSKIIKLVVTKNEGAQDETIVLDLEDGEILVESWMSSYGINSEGETQSFDDKEEVLHLLETYNVQGWKDDYTTEDLASYDDGVGWNVWLQYEDGTVQSHKGSGSGLVQMTPEGFNDFFNELEKFVNKHLEMKM